MKEWSDNTILDQFRIKFFLDTNILILLIDETYTGLIQLIDYLKNSPFADLISSQYVIFEFMGVRKREHYLREVIRSKIDKSGSIDKININSLFRYKNSFEVEGTAYEDVKDIVKQAVQGEIERITNDFLIQWSHNIIHEGLLEPTIDICLSSKLSREDSLVLCTATSPTNMIPEEFVYILSNDKNFVKYFKEANLEIEFINHSLEKPIIEYLRDIQLINNRKIDFTNTNDDAKIPGFINEKLKELIIEKNKNLFLGKTIKCPKKAPDNTICFDLEPNTTLNTDIYITIIGKELNFIYSIKYRTEDFWRLKPITSYPYISTEKVRISFRIYNLEENRTQVELGHEIIEKLKETGNLVFVHPDS